MKKFYTNKLPKDLNGKVEGVRIENGQLIVEVEFEKKFEPKDGDFLVIDGGIFIYNPNSEAIRFGLNGYYVCMTLSKNIYIYENGGHDGFGSMYNDEIRMATPKEKADFLKRLEKEYGKRWNAEKKQLEDIRWRADKKGMYYYLVAGETPVVHSCVDIGILCDNIRYNAGNYFRTHEAAQKVADQIKDIFKNSKAE